MNTLRLSKSTQLERNQNSQTRNGGLCDKSSRIRSAKVLGCRHSRARSSMSVTHNASFWIRSHLSRMGKFQKSYHVQVRFFAASNGEAVFTELRDCGKAGFLNRRSRNLENTQIDSSLPSFKRLSDITFVRFFSIALMAVLNTCFLGSLLSSRPGQQ